MIAALSNFASDTNAFSFANGAYALDAVAFLDGCSRKVCDDRIAAKSAYLVVGARHADNLCVQRCSMGRRVTMR